MDGSERSTIFLLTAARRCPFRNVGNLEAPLLLLHASSGCWAEAVRAALEPLVLKKIQIACSVSVQQLVSLCTFFTSPYT